MKYQGASKNKFSLHGGASLVAAQSVDECAIGKDDMVGEFDSDIEEGVSVIQPSLLLHLVKVR